MTDKLLFGAAYYAEYMPEDRLEKDMDLLAAAGYRVGNLDATIIAQAPKCKPYIPAMRQAIAADLGVSIDRVSVKATTEEGLGFSGRGEGIACHAVCLLEAAARPASSGR